MSKKRVVVTGIGCLTAIGCNKNDFWNSLIEGKSGAKTIDFLDAENLPVKFSASVKDFDSEKYFDRKEQKKMDIFMQYGMAAGIDAVTDSKLLDCEFDANRVGVSIGLVLVVYLTLKIQEIHLKRVELEGYLHFLFLQV